MLPLLALTTVVAPVGGLIALLIWLLILAVVIWCVFTILGMLPIPQPIKNIICAILGLILLLALLEHIGLF